MINKILFACVCSFSVFCNQSLFSEQTSLKVLTSVVAPESVVFLAVQNYAIGKELSCTLLSVGDNDTYLVTASQKKYILRIYRYKKHWLHEEENYIFELEWLTFLKEKNLPVSYPIQRLDGGFLGTISAPEGQRYWALFSFAEGEVTLDVTSAEAYGQSIAEIHVASNAFKTFHQKHQANLDFLIDIPVARIINDISNNRKEDVHYLRVLAANLKARIESIPFSGDEYGIIGGDFHGQNHHIDEQGKITHFDFDLCGYGWRAYDVAVFRWARARDDDDMWNAFLKGYNSVRPLSDNEMKAISVFVLIRHIWLMGSHTTYPDIACNKEYWDLRFKNLRKLENKYLSPQQEIIDN
jgi:Ser/Thr protein kinase RdoA (MazF antagonist)